MSDSDEKLLRHNGLNPSPFPSPDRVGKWREKDKNLRTRLIPGLVDKPHIDSLLADGYSVVSSELRRLKLKAELEGLSALEARQFKDYVDAAKKLASEEREQRSADRHEKMSNKELLEAADEARRILGVDGVSVEPSKWLPEAEEDE